MLIIEDEPAIRSGLIDVFVYHGFEVDFAVDGEEGLSKARRGGFDLILLDVMMPKLDGFSVLKAIRQHDAEQAVIMLTARGGDDDVIQGLSMGADDYVAKPFSVAQLVLRVQAVLRRTRSAQDEQAVLHLAQGKCVDTRNLCLTNDVDTRFTRREMDVLQYLHAHAERPVPREELLHKVWGYARDAGVETRTVDIHIAKIRRKLEPESGEPQVLITVRGGGYRLLRDAAG
nr:response regulator transcription factor [Pseudomarimonas arenosa]